MGRQNSSGNGARQPLTTRSFNKLKPEHFRLPSDDTRKEQYLWRQRRSLFVELRGYADSDGTNVRPAVATLAESLGFARRTVFRRLDDLKKLGLLVDEAKIAHDKPVRRHLNLARVQELLGVSCEERPKGLPDFVPTQLWQQVISVLEANDKLRVKETREQSIDYLVAGLVHQFHALVPVDPTKPIDAARAQAFVLATLHYTIAIGYVPMDWSWWDMLGCDVQGCPAYQQELVFAE